MLSDTVDRSTTRESARMAASTGSRHSDPQLIRIAKGGDSTAVEELVRRHWDKAHRAAFLITQDAAAAEDVTQEAMLSAINALDRFDRRRPFRPWLHRIVANRSLDWLRARARRLEVPELQSEAGAVDPDDAVLSDPLLSALRALDPPHRTVIVLRYLLDYSPKEIAGFLDLPAGSVRSRLSRGLAELRDQVDPKELLDV